MEETKYESEKYKEERFLETKVRESNDLELATNQKNKRKMVAQ